MTINNLTHTHSDNSQEQVQSATAVFKHIKRTHDKNIIELNNTLDEIEAVIVSLENRLNSTANRIAYIDSALSQAQTNLATYKAALNG